MLASWMSPETADSLDSGRHQQISSVLREICDQQSTNSVQSNGLKGTLSKRMCRLIKLDEEKKNYGLFLLFAKLFAFLVTY